MKKECRSGSRTVSLVNKAVVSKNHVAVERLKRDGVPGVGSPSPFKISIENSVPFLVLQWVFKRGDEVLVEISPLLVERLELGQGQGGVADPRG